MTNEEIERRLITLELSMEQAHDRFQALQLSLTWLMNQTCPEEAQRFLGIQANELELSPKLAEHTALLDELREDLAQWRAQSGLPQQSQPA